MRSRFKPMIAIVLVSMSLTAAKKKKEDKEPKLVASAFSGLNLRLIGPALTGGRITDFAVDPQRRSRYFVATASGGVWRTENAGTTWKPIFDQQGSYSIGCLAMDPNNPHVIWVGTGENNSQRSVGYGDGIYRSIDGGDTWSHMGLKESEHIGKIIIDPRDSNIVYAAAQGPLWREGGDRGLYKTTDGGVNWERVLEISEHTGISDLVLDPRDPDVLIASAYQRRRHVWTLINGGPESAIYKSDDGGASWRKITNGLPKRPGSTKGDTVELGRIGLALAPSMPDRIYAIVEASGKHGGLYRSDDRGESWAKKSDYVSSSPQYYQELVVAPDNADVVYSLDTWLHVSLDGGEHFTKVGEKTKHVDNHAMWIDPNQPEYLLVGCDGGIYESFDRGSTWNFLSNLPIVQFYKITTDNDEPFYNVYGGTQDNFTLGGPSRTLNVHGITNQDWYVTLGGDGFQSQVDPENPDIVYSQYQYGNLARFDRQSGERIFIKPMPAAGEPALRWNWDSPLIISPHDPHRLYFGANILYRSDDRGNNWTAVSPDLTRQLDRNKLKVMGRVWSVDSVSKNRSTSVYGNLVSLSESPLEQGFIVTGSDDGLVQVTLDGGENWRRLDTFPGIPERSYVATVVHSGHEAGRIYVGFNNHKMGDFKPYLLRSDDRGQSWRSVAGNLPERGSIYSFVEDHVNPDLLFAGTEFGVYASLDGGTEWAELSGGMPTIAVRGLEIQRRENDLVVGTFGRGIYILDDLSPLRMVTAEGLKNQSYLFPLRRAWLYVPEVPLGIRGKAFQGDNYYAAENPPFGAVISYYLHETPKTRQETRQEAETKAVEAGKDVSYPSWDELRAEDREEEPSVVLTISDANGRVVRRLDGPAKAGFHRVAWDLRMPAPNPVDLKAAPFDNPFADPPMGPLCRPGQYTVAAALRHQGQWTQIGEPQTFEVRVLGEPTTVTQDRGALLAFQAKTAELRRSMMAANEVLKRAGTRIDHLKQAVLETPGTTPEHGQRIRQMELRLADLKVELMGDSTISSRSEPVPPSIYGRVARIISDHWLSTSSPTQTHRDGYRIAADAFTQFLEKLDQLVQQDLVEFEKEMEGLGAPWTPGRFPDWNDGP